LKRPLVIGALSAIMLALFTLPSLADPVVPAEGEAPPVPPETQPLPAEDEPPATTADACPAQALDPTSCQGLPETPPYDCSTGVESAQGPELCESGSTQDLQTVELAALMAATDAVADAAANSSSGPWLPPPLTLRRLMLPRRLPGRLERARRPPVPSPKPLHRSPPWAL
jgi:hypothetical protein